MRSGLLAIANETYKGLLLDWNYKFNLFLELVIMAMAFVGITFLMGDGHFQQEQLASSLLGYLVWFYAMQAITDMSWNLRHEIQTGTLEQMAMSPTSTALLILGQALATLLSTTIMVCLIGGGLVLLLHIELPLRLAALPVLALTITGLFGFGFIIGAATLVYKHIEAFGDLIQYLLLFLNGALLPVDRFPEWLAFIAKILPTTQGIVVLRRVVLDGQSLAVVWRDGSLLWLLVHSTFFFLVGWLIFRWSEGIAKRQGTLGQY